jgi:hypothetical protein
MLIQTLKRTAAGRLPAEHPCINKPTNKSPAPAD